MQLLSLMMRTDVHCVCVAREWSKIGVNYQGLKLTNNSIKHGTILAFDGSIQCFNFSIYRKGKTTTI